MTTSPGRTRVLVVDDSVLARRFLGEIVGGAPDLELVGTAASGRVALSKIPLLLPDIVTLDVEMEDMDGLTTLREIRKAWPSLTVIMCSSITERGAAATLDALAAGARDYIAKPTASAAGHGVGGLGPEGFAADLLRKLRAHRPVVLPAAPRPVTSASASASAIVRAGNRVRAVVMGVSTGGPNALATLIGALPAELAVPVLIVQHMPPLFTRLLAERLDRSSPLTVKEAVDGEPITAGVVYVAPGDRHLALAGTRERAVTSVHAGPPENSCRPAVDVLFRSAAELLGAGALGVVLTGMGQDGLRGAERLREAGGEILVQDEATSVVWGMPGALVQHGLADDVLPLGDIADAICRRVQPAPAGRRAAGPRVETR